MSLQPVISLTISNKIFAFAIMHDIVVVFFMFYAFKPRVVRGEKVHCCAQVTSIHFRIFRSLVTRCNSPASLVAIRFERDSIDYENEFYSFHTRVRNQCVFSCYNNNYYYTKVPLVSVLKRARIEEPLYNYFLFCVFQPMLCCILFSSSLSLPFKYKKYAEYVLIAI